MEKTENLGLWLPGSGDPVEVSKLSENFQTLDTTVNAELTKLLSLITTAQTTADGRSQIKAGSYAGTGEASKTISVGFKPDIFIVMAGVTGSTVKNMSVHYTTIFVGQPSENAYYESGRLLTRTFLTSGSGITISASGNASETLLAEATCNSSNTTYYWAAVGT